MVIKPLLVLACTDLIGTPMYQPCVKSFEAAAVQSGISQTVDRASKRYERIYGPKIVEELGLNTVLILATAYTVGVKKEVAIRTGRNFLSDNASIILRPNSIGLGLGWTIP